MAVYNDSLLCFTVSRVRGGVKRKGAHASALDLMDVLYGRAKAKANLTPSCPFGREKVAIGPGVRSDRVALDLFVSHSGANLIHLREVDEEVAALAQDHRGGVIEGGHLHTHAVI